MNTRRERRRLKKEKDKQEKKKLKLLKARLFKRKEASENKETHKLQREIEKIQNRETTFRKDRCLTKEDGTQT